MCFFKSCIRTVHFQKNLVSRHNFKLLKIRFLTLLVKQQNQTFVLGRSGTTCSFFWYFWKLPVDDVTILTQSMVWLFYSLHQVFIWGLIYRAQLIKTMTMHQDKSKKYG